MSEKPILFNTEMVRAILDDRKTVTRRLVKPQPPKTARLTLFGDMRNAWDSSIETPGPDDRRVYTPPFFIGDILYVRETWGDYRENYEDGEGFYYFYKADYPDGAKSVPLPEDQKTDYADAWDLPKWHPSIHMPKEAARIWLRVTNLRVERLRDITEEDAVREGLYKGWRLHGRGSLAHTARQAFMWLWETITRNAPAAHSWALNPWVWVVEFERCEDPGKIKQPTLRDQGGPVIQKDHEDRSII